MNSTVHRAMFGPCRMRLILVLVLGVAFVGLMPFAAGDSSHFVDPSMQVSRSEASPGDLVTFWISISPRGEDLQRLVVTEVPPDGLSIVSSSAPSWCAVANSTWSCVREEMRAFSIQVDVVVNFGTEGQHLVNAARIDNPANGQGHQPVTVTAGVLVVPASPGVQPDLQVRVSAAQDAVIPGTELNYRIRVENIGTAPAANVSVTVTMPSTMVLLSASPWPAATEGALNWTRGSLPVGSFDFLFNVTLPSVDGLNQVQVAAAVTYGDGQGGNVTVQGLPSSLGVVPVASPAPSLPIGMILAAVAVVGGSLFIVQRTVGLPSIGRSDAEEIFLLHRSGLVLEHLSHQPFPRADSDIVGGMMAAMRMFVEDSLSPYSGHLREIKFGSGNIVFVNGENVTLAAVNSRGKSARFANRAMRFLREFERKNGEALRNFDGVSGGLEGAHALVNRFARGPAEGS